MKRCLSLFLSNNALSSVNRNYGYSYDNASRITSITEPRGTVSISSYSDRNEVQGITEPSGSPFSDQAFTYDAGFNRATWTLGTATTDYTANNLNQYSAVGSVTPTYNTDGGLATFSGNTYTYDALGRLTEVDYSAGKTLFTYDPFGRRVGKVDKNTSGTVLATYAYHYDGSAVAVEYRPSSVTWTYYGGVLRSDGTLSDNQYYYRDGQGSVSAVTDNSGNVLEAYEYTAQGWFQITNGTGTVLSSTGIGNDCMYANYRYDSETGNYFCNARYYNPKLGRFISRDPLGGAEFSQGTNLYAYCGNDCANETDPSGMGGTWGYREATPQEYSLNWGNGPIKVWIATTPSATANGSLFNTVDLWNNRAIGGRGCVPLIPLGPITLGLTGSFSVGPAGIKISLGFGLVLGVGGSIGASTSIGGPTQPGTPVPFVPSNLNATYQNSWFVGGNFGPDPFGIGPGAAVSVNGYQGGGGSATVYGPINGGASGSAGVQTTVTIPW